MAVKSAGGPCPCLGRCDDPDNFFGFASDGNCCHSGLRPFPLERPHQEDHCLGDGWPGCPRYEDYLTSGGSRNPILAFAVRALDQAPTVWSFGLVAIVVAAILAGIWFLALRPKDLSRARMTAAWTPPAPSTLGTVTATGTRETPTQTPTRTASPTMQPSRTPTPSASPTATHTPTWTPSPTPSLTPSTTPSPSPSPEPSMTPAPTVTVPRPTRRPTRTPTPLPAPELLSPEDGRVFSEDDEIVLRWQSVGVLPADTYYAITLAYYRLGEVWYDDIPWTEDTNWALSEHDYLLDMSDDGQFQWSVQVMRQTGLDDDGKATGSAISPRSEVWSLTWQRSGSAPSAPTPPPPPP
jgi:hypothetical protein